MDGRIMRIRNWPIFLYDSATDDSARIGGLWKPINSTNTRPISPWIYGINFYGQIPNALLNLHRYAFNLPARGSVGAPVVPQVIDAGGQKFLAVSFNRRTQATDLFNRGSHG